jgi:NADH:ubiquinone oxidoreductase subunit K
MRLGYIFYGQPWGWTYGTAMHLPPDKLWCKPNGGRFNRLRLHSNNLQLSNTMTTSGFSNIQYGNVGWDISILSRGAFKWGGLMLCLLYFPYMVGLLFLCFLYTNREYTLWLFEQTLLVFEHGVETLLWEALPQSSEADLLVFGITLFFLSLLGICFNNQGNILIVMLFLELMLYSLSFLSTAFSLSWGYPQGQIFSLLIMAVAVAAAAIGLGLLIRAFRAYDRVELNEFSYMKG